MSANIGSSANAAEDLDVKAAPAAQPAAATQQQGREQLQGLAALRMNMQAPMGRSTAGEAVNRFKTAIEKVFEKEKDSTKGLKVLALEGASRGSALSAIILCRVAEGKASVATLVVAASAPNLPPTEYKAGSGGSIELPTVPGAVNNLAYWNKVCAVVRESFGEVKCFHAGTNVIPVEMSDTDEARVRALVYYTDCGIYNVLMNATGRNPRPFDVSMLKVEGVKVTTRRNFSPDPVETVTGLPIRADIGINVIASENSKSPLDASAVPLASASAMVDLIYAPPAPPTMGMQQETMHYLPHIIVNKMEPLTDRVGLEGQLFALLQLPLLAKHYSWANVYRNREGVQGYDPRDIGAIGYDVPQFAGVTNGTPTRIDTKASNFDDKAFISLIMAAIRANPVISIDVEDTGEMSWLNTLFAAAANGSDEANRQIITAFDNLTCGHFSNLFKGGPIFVDSGNPVHLGYYINERDGQRHDIREVDYLAVLNAFGASDPKAVRDFEETFDSSSREPLVRLEKRLRIIEAVVGTSMRITGTARRITVTSAALEAGVQAIVNTGLVITPDNVYADFTGNGRRGNEVLSRLAYQGQAFNQLFAHSQPAFNGNMGMGMNFMFGGIN